MTSFFEKLKKGMGIEEPTGETVEAPDPNEEEIIKQIKEARTKKIQKKKPVPTDTENVLKEEEPQLKKLEIKAVQTEKEEDKEEWSKPEGQLAIDVYQTEQDLVIQSAIAGVKPESLDISIEKDIITIKGSREKPFEEQGDYFSQECFWGPFSREVILPAEVNPNQVTAEMKEGILTIRIPKILREKKRKIVVTN